MDPLYIKVLYKFKYPLHLYCSSQKYNFLFQITYFSSIILIIAPFFVLIILNILIYSRIKARSSLLAITTSRWPPAPAFYCTGAIFCLLRPSHRLLQGAEAALHCQHLDPDHLHLRCLPQPADADPHRQAGLSVHRSWHLGLQADHRSLSLPPPHHDQLLQQCSYLLR